MLTKIVNENRGWSETMTLADVSNNQHTFSWNDQFGAYCYEPKDQKELDDILKTNWEWPKVVWKVSVVMDGSQSAIKTVSSPSVVSTLRIPPYVKPELYDNYPLVDLLALSKDSGFTPELNPEDTTCVKVQLHRYYEGRAWAAEEMKRLTAKVSLLERELAASKPVIEQVAVITPTEAQITPELTPSPKKRGRPRKVQELQPA